MTKRKKLLCLLILSTLLLPILALAISSASSTPSYSPLIEQALLFQALTPKNVQTPTSQINQNQIYIKTPNANSENSGEIGQKEISTKSTDLLGAGVWSAIDSDTDGYYERLRLMWAADTDLPSDKVFIAVYARDTSTSNEYLAGVSSYKTIYGGATPKVYFMYVSLPDYAPTSTYDLRIDLYNMSGLQDAGTYGEWVSGMPMEYGPAFPAGFLMMLMFTVIPGVLTSTQLSAGAQRSLWTWAAILSIIAVLVIVLPITIVLVMRRQ